MTTTFKGVYVAFDREIREDDAEVVIQAIAMIKGVCAVDPEPADGKEFMTKAKLKNEFKESLYQLIDTL